MTRRFQDNFGIYVNSVGVTCNEQNPYRVLDAYRAAQEMEAICAALHSPGAQPQLCLDLDTMIQMDLEARKAWFNHPCMRSLEQLAFVAQRTVPVMIASFIMEHLPNTVSTEIFSNQQEAMSWLLLKRKPEDKRLMA